MDQSLARRSPRCQTPPAGTEKTGEWSIDPKHNGVHAASGAGQDTTKYLEIATALGISEGAMKQAALEMRREFGTVLRDEIRRTVADEAQIDGEIRYLLGLLRG